MFIWMNIYIESKYIHEHVLFEIATIFWPNKLKKSNFIVNKLRANTNVIIFV